MTNPSSILIVGAGSPNADMVAEVLNANGFNAQWTDKIRFPNPFYIHQFGLVYGIYLQTSSRYIIIGKILRKKTIIHFVGSDAVLVREGTVDLETDILEDGFALHGLSVVCFSTSLRVHSKKRFRASISNSLK